MFPELDQMFSKNNAQNVSSNSQNPPTIAPLNPPPPQKKKKKEMPKINSQIYKIFSKIHKLFCEIHKGFPLKNAQNVFYITQNLSRHTQCFVKFGKYFPIEYFKESFLTVFAESCILDV